MNEEDFSILVTSIDENDIEIISSNESEIDQFDFIPDNFGINNVNLHSVISNDLPITRLNREDSEDFEDETLIERLYGLSEMFPDWLQTYVITSFRYSKISGNFLRNSFWFFSSSFFILVLPILVQFEFSQVTELQAAQAREILLGPTAQIGTNSMFGK